MRFQGAVLLILIMSLIVPASAGYDVIAVSDVSDFAVITESQISQPAEDMGYNTKTVYLRSYPVYESLPAWYPAVPLPLRIQLQTDNVDIVITRPASGIMCADDSSVEWSAIMPATPVSKESQRSESLAGGSCNSIERGENHYYVQNIPEDKKSIRCDLNWTGGSERDALSLMIFPPDKVLGPFMDGDDGRVDGRILIDVSGLQGLASGNWYYRVGGRDLSEEVKYTFVTYS